MTLIQHNNRQRGAVSLFIVIFTTLLITTIVVSFVQLMVKDQRQAMYSDLSESAYDSALAGVEDAKRVLLMRQDCESGSDRYSAQVCNDIQSSIDSSECSTLSDLSTVLNNASGEEVVIAQPQSGADSDLNQAYTCVKITRDTQDYLGTIEAGGSTTLVPLRARGSFNNIKLSWAVRKGGDAVEFPDFTGTGITLPVRDSLTWKENFPALMRVQLINAHGSEFHLSDFNTSGYNNTLFLYPSLTGVASAMFTVDDRSREATDANPLRVRCSNPASGDYACSITLAVGDSGAEIADGSTTAFLHLAAFYNATDYKVELFNDSTPVLFDNVQPEVDSTGRANDLFRRVISRVELNNSFNYPAAALETRNSLCKNFTITNNAADYNSGSTSCEPVKAD